MASNPETQALLEQALHHILQEQARIFKSREPHLLLESARKLGQLATHTWELLRQGSHKIGSTSSLTRLAIAIEDEVDDISAQNWFHLSISASSIFKKIEETSALTPVQERLKLKAALQLRTHFHNLRILLLEQLLGARMLINNNDYGGESERVWKEFLQAQLGPEFRVLQGGHIIDYEGNDAGAQVDLIIVSSDSYVMNPSSLNDGKINVFCDQVLAAIMVTSNLTVKKLAHDWVKLSRVSKLFKFTDAVPQGKEQAWPLCYLVAGQSDQLPNLKEEWMKLVSQVSNEKFVPQFVVSLDGGYLYSGATSWPRPRYPVNYTEENQVVSEEGIYAGLGIGWILTQVRARAQLLKNRSVTSVSRFTKLLDDATLKSATPATWAPRFDKFGSVRVIEGNLWWGHICRWAHNRLYLSSLKKECFESQPSKESHFLREGVDVSQVNSENIADYLRWFTHAKHFTRGGLVVLEEWIQDLGERSYSNHYAIFDSVTGIEVKPPTGWQEIAKADLQEALKHFEK